jgi:hypothetical protein
MSESKRDVIYVDLDALLDTRLGCLATVNDDYALNAMKGDYFTRTSDTFPDMSLEAFREAYAVRDVSVLKRSVLTNIMSLLSSFVKASMENIAGNGQNTGLEICINTYPYQMEQEDRIALLHVMQLKLGTFVEVSAINVSDAELTPKRCKDTYAAMVRYSFHDWVQTHLEEWKKVKMPGVAVYAPMLYAKVPTEQELKELAEMKLEPFQATELACVPLFALRLLEVEMFCIHNGIKARRGSLPSGSRAVEDLPTPEGGHSPA